MASDYGKRLYNRSKKSLPNSTVVYKGDGVPPGGRVGGTERKNPIIYSGAGGAAAGPWSYCAPVSALTVTSQAQSCRSMCDNSRKDTGHSHLKSAECSDSTMGAYEKGVCKDRLNFSTKPLSACPPEQCLHNLVSRILVAIFSILVQSVHLRRARKHKIWSSLCTYDER